jgi:voltage-gated potassium channel
MKFKERIYRIIFFTDTPLGKAFDIVLLILILLSVVIVALESVSGIRAKYGDMLTLTEWIITILFTA